MSKVKTRFAPSPTGYLHLGNARTAIFSYLFARHNNGGFVLRIEDTDPERSKKEYEEMLIEDLKWLGIDWDEFYRQSERFDIYREYVNKLLESGHAYPCFCTPEELEKEREEARKKGIPYRYSGKCRHLTPEEVEKFKKEGKPFAIRFKVPENRTVVFEDLIKGHIAINTDDFGDFVIVRSDGSPTYNFVVVVDDALMGITHVIRGEDHIPNTPKQILIYEALGFPVPKFAHLPVILGEDRSKLSKRHGAVSVRAYREEGYMPEALFNYLCLLGWSPPEEGREIFSKEELIKIFDLKDVNDSPAVFNKEKLKWMNGVYIREVLPLDVLLERAIPFLEKAGYDTSDREYIKKVLEYTRDSFDTLSEMVDRLRPFFVDEFEIPEELWSFLDDEKAYQVLSAFLEKIREKKPETPQEVKKLAKEIQKALKVKPPQVWKPLRIALTGELEGVGIDILIAVLPKEKIEKRILRVLEKLS
ncbi:glutamate--tRNA ligase [Aquifex aeolicus]|uniref:Glutamate--tRNA ligase n=1 Tax=Aquifex aeolicus (strain VF5) TaxID=224324 RepID=SYE_AQUAE|nr:glutamate--tRNA ligase [Aquifex aeolicus]O67271.1 RecName: Full=Glutamate--tRNA ligase; AltName: Full=Glutamyl-tRNA synthetase; Short=GluRS [Aquifex aeolicus VF5]AAC07230.1 glutamyl-tRNA synthetase [Aquifex aeolicus VF5]